MADNLIVTQDAKFEIISAKPSINKKQVGPNVVEIPYDVSQTLDKAVDVSPNVKANGKPVVLMSSTMPEVIGDEEGSLGGVDSGTVGGPTKCTQGSSTVTINGQKAIRVDDTMDMQGGNTFGKITMSSSSSNAITDEFNKKVLEDLHEFLNSPAKESLENINSPSTSRPGATNEAGCLGSSTGSPVLLNTRQLYLKQTDLTFKGINPIDVKRVYVARNHKNNNMFGNHWLFFYAQRFVNITQELESEEDKTRFKISNIDYSKNITYDMLNYSQTNKDKLVQEKKTKHIYNLYLNDSRVFEFEYDLKNDSFKDLGKLGVSIQKTNDTYIITYNDGKKETYTNENLVLIEDKNNNKISMVFNHNNQIVMIKNHCNTISLTYNNNNQVEYIKDNVSRVTKYKYDTNNNLIEVIDAKNNITKYVYKSIKEKNNSISYLLTNHLHNDVSLLNATYDNKAQVKSYNDKQTVYNYRFDQNSVKKTNSMKESVIYGLDSYGLIKAISLDHKLVQAVEFNKKTNTLEYKLNDKIIKHEIYDNQSRLLKTIDINPMSFEKNIIKEYEYTKGVTLPIKITNHKTNTIQTYDNNGNLLELLENNLKQTYEYNKDGQIIKYTNNNNIQTLYEYDEHKRLIKQINPNNQIILFKYDLLNNLVKVIDQEQRVTSYVYDKLNYLTKTINGNGYITTYTYDNNNLLTHISDANKNTTTYTYNKHNNIIKESNNLGTKDISYANNNLINTISFNLNTQTQITRDDKNNIIKTSIGDEYILYEYDKKDNLISAKRYTNNKLACVLQYEYNTNNKLISCIQDGIEIKRRYNHEKDNSSLKHILFLNEVISYDINPKTNLLDQITIGLHDINLEYNNNQLTKKTFTSYLKSDEINMDNLEQTIQLNHKRDLHNQIDINNKIIKQTQTMFYDTNNQIEQISTNNTNIKYQRDKTNLITQIDDNEKITNYTYDNGKRLISACDDKINLKTIQKQPQHIKSDILNLTNDKFVISNFLQEPIKEEKINIDGFTQYEYDKVGNLLNNNSVYKNNQLVQNDNYYYVYDKAGNLKAKKSTTTSKQIEYRYNNFNELISVKYYIKAKLVKTLLFTYDALRRRASKQLIDNINNYKHYYLYDGLNIIAILDSNKQLLSTITHNNELDSPLSITTNNKTYFYYTNAQGSITHLTNCHGNIVEKISYDAYGNITNHIQKEKTNNIYFFTAKQKDDIDLYYYKFRYYDATTFRFICLDPISHESNDTNHYSYVFNDPLNQTDDLGLYTPGSLSLALNPIKPPTQYKTMLGQTTKTNIQKQSLQTETKEFKTPTIKEIVANAPRDGVKILATNVEQRKRNQKLSIDRLYLSYHDDDIQKQPNTHIIKKGDTLIEIGEMYGVSHEDIAKLNKIENHDLIIEGNTLIIPDFIKMPPQLRIVPTSLNGKNIILGSELTIVSYGTHETKVDIEVLVNGKPFEVIHNGKGVKKLQLEFDGIGKLSTLIQLRPKDDEDFKKVIKEFSPKIGKKLQVLPITLKASSKNDSHTASLESNDNNTVSLNLFGFNIKKASITNPQTNQTLATLTIQEDENEILFIDQESNQLVAKTTLPSLINALGVSNNALGGIKGGLQRIDGTFALKNSKGVKFKHYPNNWNGNGAVKVYSASKWASGLSKANVFLTVLVSGYQIDSSLTNDSQELNIPSENKYSTQSIGENTEQTIGSVAGGLAGGAAVGLISTFLLPVTATAFVTIGTFVVVGVGVGWVSSLAGKEAVEFTQELKGTTILNDYPLNINEDDK